MKIIRPGKEPKKSTRIWKGSCLRCGLTLEADDSEVTFPDSTDPARGPMFSFVKCPHCTKNGKDITIMLNEKRIRGET